MLASCRVLRTLLKDPAHDSAMLLASVGGGDSIGRVAGRSGKEPGSTRSEDGTSTGV